IVGGEGSGRTRLLETLRCRLTLDAVPVLVRRGGTAGLHPLESLGEDLGLLLGADLDAAQGVETDAVDGRKTAAADPTTEPCDAPGPAPAPSRSPCVDRALASVALAQLAVAGAPCRQLPLVLAFD